jgi:hypothetical protein
MRPQLRLLPIFLRQYHLLRSPMSRGSSAAAEARAVRCDHISTAAACLSGALGSLFVRHLSVVAVLTGRQRWPFITIDMHMRACVSAHSLQQGASAKPASCAPLAGGCPDRNQLFVERERQHAWQDHRAVGRNCELAREMSSLPVNRHAPFA